MKLANGATRMNPSTLLRLWEAFEGRHHAKHVHVLEIGAITGCWPGTVYRAVQFGYLVRTKPAHFQATAYFRQEVRQAQRNLNDRSRVA